MRPIHIAGLTEGTGKDLKIEELGRRLWNDRLGPHLDAAQADDRRDRARALVVENSYPHGALLAAGMGEVTDPRRNIERNDDCGGHDRGTGCRFHCCFQRPTATAGTPMRAVRRCPVRNDGGLRSSGRSWTTAWG